MASSGAARTASEVGLVGGDTAVPVLLPPVCCSSSTTVPPLATMIKSTKHSRPESVVHHHHTPHTVETASTPYCCKRALRSPIALSAVVSPIQIGALLHEFLTQSERVEQHVTVAVGVKHNRSGHDNKARNSHSYSARSFKVWWRRLWGNNNNNTHRVVVVVVMTTVVRGGGVRREIQHPLRLRR